MSNRIQTLPNKYPELGRLRAGFNNDSGNMEPLRNWRMTSKSEAAIGALASIYGGTPQPWSERAGEWELFSESNTLQIQLPYDALFTAYEKWGQGGNQRRCDGEVCTVPVLDPEGGHLAEVECWCLANGLVPGEAKNACTVTVRLKVVLPNIPGLGIWMFTSGSVYAAMELPAQVDTIDAIRSRTDLMLPCDFILEYREEKRSYEKFTRKYSVPSLRVNQSMEQIIAQVSGPKRPSIAPAREPAPPARPAAPAPPPGLPPGAGEPAQGPPAHRVSGHTGPPIKKPSWNITQVAELLEANQVPKGRTMKESLDNLVAAGIVEL